MEILELEINKKNTEIVSTNSTTCYVMGIGETDYTIHRDADDIHHMYADPYGFYKNFTTENKHQYHVFESRIKSIAGDIKWKDKIIIDDKTYKVNNAYIGLPNKCKLIYHPYGNRSIDYLTFEGDDMSVISEPLKYVLTVETIDGQ